jgi:hypothetical protein
MADAQTIGDKIPSALKPVIQQVVAALLASLVLWFVGQGLLAPTNQKLADQVEEIRAQNAELKSQSVILHETLRLRKAEAEYWSIPIPASVTQP